MKRISLLMIAVVPLVAFESESLTYAQSGGINCSVECTAHLDLDISGQIPSSVHFYVSAGVTSSTVGQAVCERCATNPVPCKYDGWVMEWTGNSVHKLEISRPGGQIIAPDQLTRPGALATHCGESPDFVVFKIYYTASSPWTLMYTHSMSLSCGC